MEIARRNRSEWSSATAGRSGLRLALDSGSAGVARYRWRQLTQAAQKKRNRQKVRPSMISPMLPGYGFSPSAAPLCAKNSGAGRNTQKPLRKLGSLAADPANWSQSSI